MAPRARRPCALTRSFEAEAAPLDGEAAVLYVEQAGGLGDLAGLGGGDAELKPERGGADGMTSSLSIATLCRRVAADPMSR